MSDLRAPPVRGKIVASIACALLVSCGGGGSPSATDAPQRVAHQWAATLPTTYTLVNLGSGRASFGSRPINAMGQVAYTSTDGGGSRAYFYDGSASVQVSGLGTQANALGVNDAGQVIGQAWDASGNTQSYVWSSAAPMRDLAVPADGATPVAINAAGVVAASGSSGGIAASYVGTASSWTQVASAQPTTPADINGNADLVGNLYAPDGSSHAYLWSAGALVMLPPVAADETQSAAYAISDGGLIIGASVGARNRAVAWERGASGGVLGIDLSESDEFWSAVAAVNRSGQVAGFSAPLAGGVRSFVWTRTGPGAGTKVYLPYSGASSTYAAAINSNGQVAGQYFDGQDWHGFVWSATEGLIDLNTRVTNLPQGESVVNAVAISDSGAILATSTMGLVLLKPGLASTSPPVVGAIAVNDPLRAGTAGAFSATFTDADVADTHTATWNWGDGSADEAGSVAEQNGSGTVSGSHAYVAAGLYTATLTVVDNTGLKASVQRLVVVYDPGAGFVTGGGWIVSAAGALRSDPALSGRANFGFVAHYVDPQATTPQGNTEFQFQVGALNFHASAFKWLVVSKPRAIFSGTGAVNGRGGYFFMVTAVDGDLIARRTPDRMRIRIWHNDSASGALVVDYDNQLDPKSEGTLTEGSALASGSIVIHK